MNKFYITTSIAYVNASPHIGHALESVQADVLARWHRQQGDEVFFLTGTDEHGAKIARTASALNKTPRALVDEHAEQFIALKDALNLSWDNFIRTSDEKKHWPVAQEIWKRLVAAGDIYKKKYEGLYCVGHEAFVTNKDLQDGVCEIHKKKPEVIQEENWFFKLSHYTDEIKKRILSDDPELRLNIVPETRKNEILALLEVGLEDISFSRPSKDIPWGIPVPGDDSQTMYVWADALSNYISGYGGISAWEAHPADVHVIGKDILRFHAAIWPAMLLSAKLPMPRNILVHGFITVNGEKMSKSIGNVIDPFELVKQYGIDPVRFYLLYAITPFDDGDFSHEKFKQVYNGVLANGIGNLVSRVAKLGEELGEIKINNNDLDKENSIPNSKWAIDLKIDNGLFMRV
ncbi:MAG: methionine--tRNA ligase, partial [bacterium]|nr:methionine--tRNA ligase [bacterium]